MTTLRKVVTNSRKVVTNSRKVVTNSRKVVTNSRKVVTNSPKVVDKVHSLPNDMANPFPSFCKQKKKKRPKNLPIYRYK